MKARALPYSNGMPVDESRASAPPLKFFIELLALGAVIGIVLVALKAPVWTVYVAPLLGVPLFLRELRHIDREEQHERLSEASAQTDDIAGELLELEKLQAAARRARTRHELQEIRMQQSEYEVSHLRYERFALGLSLLWAIGGVLLGIAGVVLSWGPGLAFGSLGAIGLGIYLFRSRAFGSIHQAWPKFRMNLEDEVELQEARIGGAPNVDAVGGVPPSGGHDRPKQP